MSPPAGPGQSPGEDQKNVGKWWGSEIFCNLCFKNTSKMVIKEGRMKANLC